MLKRVRPDVIYVAQEGGCWSTIMVLIEAGFVTPEAIRIGGFTTNIDYRIRIQFISQRRATSSMSSLGLQFAVNSEASCVARCHGYRGSVLVQHGWGQIQTYGFQNVELHAAHSPFRIGYVGALIEEKGVADLIQAATLKGDWHLDIIGDGPKIQGLMSLASDLCVQSRVTFHGFLSRDKIPAHMRSLHVLVLPSHSTATWKEQFGLVLAEAMLSGVAVIGFNSGAIPEVIDTTGLLYDEGDVALLATCLRELYESPL